MKKLLLSLVLAVVAICASAAVGDTFSVGNLSYVVTGDATTINYASVHVTGLSATGKSTSSLGLVIPSTVTYNGTVYRVTYVQPSAFANQSNIVNVNIHYGVTDLNEGAFKNCTGITYVRLPSSMRYIYSKVFEGCTSLKNVYIANPDPTSGVFNSDAFPSNSGMTLFVPRTNANSVHLYKARKCFEKFATISKSSMAYDIYCSDGAYLCVTSGPTKTTRGEMTMVGFNGSASRVTDGAFVPSCGSGNYSFDNYSYDFVAVSDSACLSNSDLKSVNISACTKLTTLGKNSFKYCVNMTSFAMATTSLKEIKSGAFFGCISLTSITIPSGVTSCSPYFVDGCSSLTTINVHSSNTMYSSYSGMLYDKTQTKLLRCPEGFSGTSLVSANSFPSQMIKVGEYAFYGCSKIKYVYLPYGVQLVSSYAFTNCANLLTMKVPSSVTTWGNSVFGGSTKLELLYMNMQRPPAVRDEEFKNIERTTLVVPYSSWNSYKTAEGWKTWKNIKLGAFDIAAFDFVNATTGQAWSTNYTIHSNERVKINGKSYDGRAKLVWVDRNNATGVLKIPEYITEPTSNKKYAVTAIDSKVADDGFGADVSLTLGENVDTISESAFSGRTSLINLTLNANLTHIAEYAFYTALSFKIKVET
ncbi:MAG: leucine-rich repeat protein [Bacteroidales bacterium]|nr:leucine-rich repeat protein [Bacteroidales bacterium]